eukprot:NODE_730_length_4371_cov_0.467228.p2 type:complete len:444 gc:universal NODE_730_length_4371_cov_0.467228:750-2081(+)
MTEPNNVIEPVNDPLPQQTSSQTLPFINVAPTISEQMNQVTRNENDDLVNQLNMTQQPAINAIMMPATEGNPNQNVIQIQQPIPHEMMAAIPLQNTQGIPISFTQAMEPQQCVPVPVMVSNVPAPIAVVDNTQYNQPIMINSGAPIQYVQPQLVQMIPAQNIQHGVPVSTNMQQSVPMGYQVTDNYVQQQHHLYNQLTDPQNFSETPIPINSTIIMTPIESNNASPVNKISPQEETPIELENRTVNECSKRIEFLPMKNALDSINNTTTDYSETTDGDSCSAYSDNFILESFTHPSKFSQHNFPTLPNSEASINKSSLRNEVKKVKSNDHCCPICEKCFSRKSDINRHLKTHSGVKPFKCKYCSKSFAQKSGLTVHTRTHTGEKPYACSYCGIRFGDVSAAKKHEQSTHEMKRHLCPVKGCDKSFTRKNAVNRHLKQHGFVYE